MMMLIQSSENLEKIFIVISEIFEEIKVVRTVFIDLISYHYNSE
jgi:hypothetical protein